MADKISSVLSMRRVQCRWCYMFVEALADCWDCWMPIESLSQTEDSGAFSVTKHTRWGFGWLLGQDAYWESISDWRLRSIFSFKTHLVLPLLRDLSFEELCVHLRFFVPEKLWCAHLGLFGVWLSGVLCEMLGLLCGEDSRWGGRESVSFGVYELPFGGGGHWCILMQSREYKRCLLCQYMYVHRSVCQWEGMSCHARWGVCVCVCKKHTSLFWLGIFPWETHFHW